MQSLHRVPKACASSNAKVARQRAPLVPRISLRLAQRTLGRMPGFLSDVTLVLLAEPGPHFAGMRPTANHLASWLGLCLDNRITGGRIHSVRRRDV